MSHPVYIFIRQTASTTNKSKNKTNAGDRWTASLSNTQPLLELITGYGKTPIATGWQLGLRRHFVANLFRYLQLKNYQIRLRFDEVIAKIKRVQLILPDTVYCSSLCAYLVLTLCGLALRSTNMLAFVSYKTTYKKLNVELCRLCRSGQTRFRPSHLFETFSRMAAVACP